MSSQMYWPYLFMQEGYIKITGSVIKEFAKKMPKIVRITNVSFSHINSLWYMYNYLCNYCIHKSICKIRPYSLQIKCSPMLFLIKTPGSLKAAAQPNQPSSSNKISISLQHYSHLILWKARGKQSSPLSPPCIPFPLTRTVSPFEVWFTGAIEPLCWLHASLQGNR